MKAHDGNRTRDLFLTKEVLYRLSYMGIVSVCTPSTPGRRETGAGNGTRTRDPELGRLALYQLSYSRSPRYRFDGGEGRIRTSEGISRQIYSLLPLATREPLRHFIISTHTRASRWPESNRQPTDYKSVALPFELHRHRRAKRLLSILRLLSCQAKRENPARFRRRRRLPARRHKELRRINLQPI